MSDSIGTPNLFTWATSELSQDAFLCWLIAWADPAHAESDPNLHACGRSFLGALFRAAGRSLPPGLRVNVLKQVHRCDVVAEVGEQYLLLIEDKVETGQHSNQLERYLGTLQEHYSTRDLVCIYLKSGEESAARSMPRGWNRYSRRAFLTVLNDAGEISNDIFLQFREHLREIDRQTGSFERLPVEEWGGRAWAGFFSAIQPRLEGSDWDYVPNATGGFMGLWWGWWPIGEGERLYLQLIQDRFVVRIEVKDRARRSLVRNNWSRKAVELEGFERPGRFGNGETMTIAEYLGGVPGLRPGAPGDVERAVRFLLDKEAAVRQLLSENLGQ